VRRSRPAAAVLLGFVLQLSSCGGSSSSSPSGGSAGPSASPPAAGSANPCSGALAAPPQAEALAAAPRPKSGPLGYDDRDPREFLALHQVARRELLRAEDGAPTAASVVAPRSGDIAVLNDNGSLVLGVNSFDLGGVGLRFEPNAQGGYDVVRTSASFRPDLGRRLALGDDASFEQPLPFAFSFYGASHGSVFVNSDGNLSFVSGDSESTERSLGRVLSGPPRAALFFADLDPEKGGGIFASATAGGFSVTWCGVPDFDNTGKATVQATLLPGGTVEMRFDSATTLRNAVVALAPGASSGFAAVDLSAASTALSGGGAALGERFSSERALDLVGAARLFYSEFGDHYDQLVFWTDTRVTEPDTFAFETTVSNQIRGIGQVLANLAAEYGSGGRLASVVVMDTLAKYPGDPTQPFLAEDTTLSLVAHETGHRWGATLRFRDAGGSSSDSWLGRQLAHWSFFTDSDGSVLEGNEIHDQGGGSFRTGAPSQRYSAFDLYAMGALRESEVPATFYVASARVTDPASGSFDRESNPRSGVTITGTRQEVTIGDVVAAMGARGPAAGSGPFSHRQAWIYVTAAGRSADAAALAKLDAFRRAFAGFFAQATGERMTVETRLE
jgi:hypothetical protein